MIIHDSIPGSNRQLIPLGLDSDALLRAQRVSANLPAHTMTWSRFTGNSSHSSNGRTDTYNQAGRFYFQPSNTAVGESTQHSVHTVVQMAASFHYSPHKDYLPTLARDDGNNYYTLNASYENGLFLPLLKRDDASKPPLHNTEINLYDTYMTYNNGAVEVNFESSLFRTCSRTNFAMSAWMLVLVSSSGSSSASITITVNPFTVFYYYGSSQTPSSTTLSGETNILLPSPDGKSKYYLIKKGWSDDWNDQTKTIGYIRQVNQPFLGVTLPKQCAMQVTSWGFDVWPYGGVVKG